MSSPDPLDLRWQDRAKCKGDWTERWYVKADDRPDIIADLRRTCGLCSVLSECREYALTRPERFGFWGGMTNSELRRERYRRRLAKREGDPNGEST
jgi:WhiB family redox-sensing transcriptional regulator